MASPTQWTWVWVNSGSWWWTGRPGMLQFMGSQRVRHNWATELNWTDGNRETITPLCSTLSRPRIFCFSREAGCGKCVWVLEGNPQTWINAEDIKSVWIISTWKSWGLQKGKWILLEMYLPIFRRNLFSNHLQWIREEAFLQSPSLVDYLCCTEDLIGGSELPELCAVEELMEYVKPLFSVTSICIGSSAVMNELSVGWWLLIVLVPFIRHDWEM